MILDYVWNLFMPSVPVAPTFVFLVLNLIKILIAGGLFYLFIIMSQYWFTDLLSNFLGWIGKGITFVEHIIYRKIPLKKNRVEILELLANETHDDELYGFITQRLQNPMSHKNVRELEDGIVNLFWQRPVKRQNETDDCVYTQTKYGR